MNKNLATILVLCCCLVAGCEMPDARKEFEASARNFWVVEYDSCEYIASQTFRNYHVLAHKGNCKYCEQRKKEVKP